MNPDFEKYAIDKLMAGKVPAVFDEVIISSLNREFPGISLSEITCLDFGCGDGRFYPYFISKGFMSDNIYGIDISQIRIDRCRSRGWNNVIQIKMGEYLPFPDDFFHFITMIEVIEHIPCSEILRYFNELSRILRKDGFIIVTTPNYPIKRVFDVYNAIRLKKWARLRDDSTHICRYNMKKTADILAQVFPHVDMRIFQAGPIYPFIQKHFFVHKILGIAFKYQITLKNAGRSQ